MVDVVIPVTRDVSKTLKSISGVRSIILVPDTDRRGASWARNEGLKRVQSDYVLFSDDDIFWMPGAIEKMRSVLDGNDSIDVVYGNFRKVFPGPHFAVVNGRPWGDELKVRNYISSMSMVRRSKCPWWDETLGRLQDWDLWLTMLEAGCQGRWINEILFDTDCNNGGISSKSDYDYWAGILRSKHALGG